MSVCANLPVDGYGLAFGINFSQDESYADARPILGALEGDLPLIWSDRRSAASAVVPGGGHRG
jgi:hypothetical protein